LRGAKATKQSLVFDELRLLRFARNDIHQLSCRRALVTLNQCANDQRTTIQPSYIAAHLDIICFAGLLREYFDAVNLGILYVAGETDNELSIGNGQGFDCFNHRLLESAGFFIRVEILKNCLFVDCD